MKNWPLVPGLVGCCFFTTVIGWYLAGLVRHARSQSSQEVQMHQVQSIEHSAHAAYPSRGVVKIIVDESKDGVVDLQNVDRRTVIMDRWPLDKLLAEFDLNGESRYLEAARLRYGNNPDFLMLAALTSSSPDSIDIKKLEEAQPNNPLPNILRAGMYASSENLPQMVDEIQTALGKDSLTLNNRDRMANVLDLLIADPSRSDIQSLNFRVNGNFNQQLESIVRVLNGKPEIFGGAEAAAAVGVNLAMKLRNAKEFDYWNRARANSIEGLVLLGVNPSLPYDDTGMTVLQRFKQLNAQGRETRKWGKVYSSVFKSSTNSETRLQFFTRMRADGEMAALNWLMRQ